MKKDKSDFERNDNDYSLWEDLRKGKSDAFLRLYDEYVDLLYAFGKNYTKDQELIKDCIHDLFLDLHKYREHLSDIRNVRFYLYSSMKRKIIREQKKTGSSLSYESALLFWEDREEIPAFEYVLIQQEELEGSNQLLLKAMSTLSPHQQKIIFLRFNQELSYPEIADLFQISVESVRTMVYRSLKILRESLKDSSDSLHLLFILTGLIGCTSNFSPKDLIKLS